ncbi:MAG: Rieske 2Fe-2S domain-containing protein [Rhodospirillales bacterium]
MTTARRLALCALEDITDGGSAGFAVDRGDGSTLGIMAIRRIGGIHLYENACPHIGTPLDFTPGQFLDLEREYILCSTHGALFRIEDGHCISGPCAGDELTSIKAAIEDGVVYALLD